MNVLRGAITVTTMPHARTPRVGSRASVDQATLGMDTLVIVCVRTADPMLCVRTTNVSVSEDMKKEMVSAQVSRMYSSSNGPSIYFTFDEVINYVI